MYLTDYEIDFKKIMSFGLHHKKIIISIITSITTLFVCYYCIRENNTIEINTTLKINYNNEIDFKDKQKQRQLIVNYNKLLLEDSLLKSFTDEYKGYYFIRVLQGEHTDTIDVKVKSSVKNKINQFNTLVLDELQNQLTKFKFVDRVGISIEGEMIKENYLFLLIAKSSLILSGTLIVSFLIGIGLDLKRR